MHACPRLFCVSSLPPRLLLCLCVLLCASACQQPSAAQTPPPDPPKTASPDTADAPKPTPPTNPATSAPATTNPPTTNPATSAPPTPPPIPVPSADAARPSAPSPGTDAQRTLLTQADQAIRDGDIDTAALTLLSLLQSPEQSEERLAGILLITEIYRAESHNMPKGQDPTKKLNRALKILTDNELKFPPTVEYYESFADVYEELKRPQDAAAALQKAISIDPGRLNLLARLTYFALSNGQPPIAAESLKQYEAARAQILPVLTSPQTPPEHVLALLSTLDHIQDPLLTPALLALIKHPDQRVIGASLQTLLAVNASDASDGVRLASSHFPDPEIIQVLNQVADMLAKNPGATPPGILRMPPPPAPAPTPAPPP